MRARSQIWAASSRAAVVVAVIATAAVGNDSPDATELHSADPAGGVSTAAKPERNSVAHATDSTHPAAKPEEIAAWITDLDDNRYLIRETATRRRP